MEDFWPAPASGFVVAASTAGAAVGLSGDGFAAGFGATSAGLASRVEFGPRASTLGLFDVAVVDLAVSPESLATAGVGDGSLGAVASLLVEGVVAAAGGFVGAIESLEDVAVPD